MVHGGAAFGERLRARRERRGLTQRELAERAGVSERAVRYIEQGRVDRPRRESVRRLAEAVGLPVDEEASGSPRDEPGQLRIGVLGPLVVTHGERPLAVGPMKQRSLLGLLALHAGEVVPRDEIIDVLWGEAPPSSCLNLVHTYVSGLRRAVPQGHGELVRSVQGGYVLTNGTIELDLLRFDDLAARAHTADDPEAALDLFAAALSAWRAPVLADLPPGVRAHPTAVAVSARRLAAALGYADLALELGHAGSAVDQLRPLTHQEPLHEGLHARLMLALAAAGQQAAALELFADLRGRLADELGVEPGSELSTAHLRVLRKEVQGAVVRPWRSGLQRPAQLPAAVAGFVGREEQLAHLDGILSPDAGPAREPGARIAVVTGPAGVGKTALAVYWAHRVRERFPDGQLHIDLRGYAPAAPVEALEALTRFLRALGVPTDRVPTDEEEAAGLYRTQLADRRMLILLDNAFSVEQIRPLLPGGPDCLVLVTSRDRLPALAMSEGARQLGLDVLTAEDSGVLLVRMLGERRARAEREALDDLSGVCAHLPLALRIAGANLVAMPHTTVARYVAELRERGRIAKLAVGAERGAGAGEGAIRAAFDLSYARLGPQARRLFRFLGLVPGPDITADAAAVLVRGTAGDVRRLLAQLTNASLLDEHADGRYQFHDLLREYAADCARDEETAEERSAARCRLFEYYLANAGRAMRVLLPYLPHAPVPPDPGPAATAGLSSELDAGRWLAIELSNVISMAVAAAEHGPRRYVWQIADVLRDYFRLRGRCVEGLRICNAALVAARRESDRNAEALALSVMGSVHGNLSEYRQSIACHRAALALNQRNTDRAGEARSYLELGRSYSYVGEPVPANECYEQALEIYREIGDGRGEALALNYLGVAARAVGNLEHSLVHGVDALRLTRQINAPDIEAQVLHSIGLTNWSLGNLDAAREYYQKCLSITRTIGHRHGEAITIVCLAETECDAGRYDMAAGKARLGMALGRELGERRHEIIGLEVLATTSVRRGQCAAAIRDYARALEAAREIDDGYSEISIRCGLSAALREVGRLAEALENCHIAVAKARDSGLRLLDGRALTELAHEYLVLGEPDKALDYATRALDVTRRRRQRLAETRALHVLGLVRQATGDSDAARRHWREALDIAPGTTPEAGALRVLLGG